MWKCMIYLAVTGILGFIIGRMLPHRWFQEDRFPYRPFSFEREGKLYEKIGIHTWQNKIPDMSRIFPKWMPTKCLDGNIPEKLPVMIKETCVAECIHVLLGIAALYCPYLWQTTGGIILTILYEIGNMAFILVQRYNRPRFTKLRNRYKRKTGGSLCNICEH